MNNLLSNIDFDDIFKKDSFYGGTYCKDQLKNSKIEDKFYVINLEDSDKGKGTHWTMCYNVRKNINIYFDSMGIEPNEDIKKFMRKAKKKMACTDIQIQNLNSDSCGHFTLYMIEQLNTGRLLTDIIFTDFDINNTNKNDMVRKVVEI